jgi:hypothetical protein
LTREFQTLEHRRAINPARFDFHHPNIAGYFTAPTCLGEQPHGPALDWLRHKYEINPHRFTANHHFWGKLFAIEERSETTCTITPPPPPPCHTSAVPEPTSEMLLVVAILACGAVYLAVMGWDLWGRWRADHPD